jgi:aspartate aminotransferase
MQHVVMRVLNEPPGVVAHIDQSRRLHRATALAAHARLVAAGVRCRPPTGGFYVYPDFEAVRPQLAAHGVDGGEALATHLLERFGIGVLSGVAFGDERNALRCRIATSRLYGENDDQRRQALAADDPAELRGSGAASTASEARWLRSGRVRRRPRTPPDRIFRSLSRGCWP